MIKYLLKKSSCIELEIFETISFNSNRVDVTMLMEEFSLSRSSVKRHVEHLNLTFLHLELATNIKQDDKHRFYLSNSAPIEDKNLYHHIQLFLLEGSPSFKLLKLFFNSPPRSKYDYCYALNVSENTFYKLVKDLNVYLKFFSVKIAKSKNNFLLVGDEHNIRFLICALFNEVYQNIKWPFQNNSIPTLKYYHSPCYSSQLEQKENSIKIRNKILLTTLNIRTQNESYVSVSDSTISQIMNVYINNDYKFNVNSFSYAGTSFEDAELLFSEIILRIFDDSIDSENRKIIIGQNLEELDNSLVLMCAALLKSFIEAFNILVDEDTYAKLMYYTVFHHIVISYFNFELRSILKINTVYKKPLLDDKDMIIQDISHFYSEFMHKQKFHAFNTNNYEKSCSELLYFILQINFIKTINVYVQYTKNVIGTLMITNKITVFFNSSSIKIVDDMADADIIISDSIETSKKGSDYFFFGDIQDKLLWQDLFYFLQTKIFKQNFHD